VQFTNCSDVVLPLINGTRLGVLRSFSVLLVQFSAGNGRIQSIEDYFTAVSCNVANCLWSVCRVGT